MKKLLYFFIFSCINVLSAQYFVEDGYYQIQKVDTEKLNRFYYLEYEFNPAKNIKTLAEIEDLSKGNKNPSIEYLINQEDSQTTKLVVKANHKIFSESYFRKGVLHGKKIIYHGNGNPFHEIDYVNGMANGIYKMYSDKGNDLVLETNYKNNVKEGKRIFYNNDRDKTIVEGNYSKGVLQGDLLIKEKRSYYFYPNDFKNGKVKRFVDDFLIEEYEILAGYLHGVGIIYQIGNNNILSKTPYTFGKKNGIAEYYNKEGKLMTKSEFKFDRKIGKHELFSHNSQLEEIQFYDENGNRTGTWTKYYRDGKKNSETTFQENGTFQTVTYDAAEKIKNISNYNQNNKPEGSTKQFENGTLKNEFFYRNGKTQWVKTYYENGTLFAIETSKGSAFEREFYDKSGKLFHTNKVDSQGKKIGMHKNATIKNDEIYVYDETYFNDKGEKIKWIYRTNTGKIEYNFRNNTQHGPKITYDEEGNISRVEYYFENSGISKLVTKDEFEKLTKSEK